MNELKNFTFEDQQIRALTIEGEPWFVGKDVAEVLGYSNSRKAIADHVDSEDKGVTKCYTLGGTQQIAIINESGLYSLILSSKLPKAKEFKRWVTSEVLPTIRKHGAYMTPAKIEEVLTDPDTIIQLATQLKQEREGRLIAEQRIGEWFLYAKYQKTGWTHSETIMVDKKDGTQKAVLNTKWTQKGRLGLYELLKAHGILPLIEREG